MSPTELIRKLLIQLNISQGELCRQLGLDPSTLTRYLQGDRSPGADVLLMMAGLAKTEELKIDFIALIPEDQFDLMRRGAGPSVRVHEEAMVDLLLNLYYDHQATEKGQWVQESLRALVHHMLPKQVEKEQRAARTGVLSKKRG